jgi:DNA polymerase/3'-5' exonuclease PolX
MTDHKNQIIAELDVLRRISVTETAGNFKARSYAAAIKTLQGLSGPILSVADIPPSTKGDGLGKEIRTKIEKIITEGRLNISEEARAKAVALEAIQNIYGVGPKKAEDLMAAGYTTVSQLRAAAAKDPKLLNKNQRIGLTYYDDLLLRIPRAEMDQHAATLMAAKPASLEGVIVGSYRRGQPNSGDIDMLIRTADPAVDAGAALRDFVAALKAQGYIKEVLAQGDHKCLAISQLPATTSSASAASSAGLLPARRLDLLVTPPEEFPFAVLYFTGSDTFNVAMRSYALTRGFTLNEHALTHLATGKPVTGIKSERDIFAGLKVQWREPHERTGAAAFQPL